VTPVEPPVLSPASFTSLVPARLLDTRGLSTVDGQFQGGGPLVLGQTVELTVANRGGVPIDADSVALNVTVTEGSGPGFVTVYPCGSQRPLTSSLNFVVGQSVPNAVITSRQERRTTRSCRLGCWTHERARRRSTGNSKVVAQWLLMERWS
jgi:hypothetical protein